MNDMLFTLQTEVSNEEIRCCPIDIVKVVKNRMSIEFARNLLNKFQIVEEKHGWNTQYTLQLIVCTPQQFQAAVKAEAKKLVEQTGG